MKEKKPFKLGATYKLKQKYIDEYNWSSGMAFVFGGTPYAFTFTPDEIDNAGGAWCRSSCGSRWALVLEMSVICSSVLTTNNGVFMKHKKDFKVGARYRLMSKYAYVFTYTKYIREQYGNGAFEFIVHTVDFAGDACDLNEEVIARSDERYMFKRVDNK